MVNYRSLEPEVVAGFTKGNENIFENNLLLIENDYFRNSFKTKLINHSMEKFTKADEFYLSERKKIAKSKGKLEIFDVADHFGLYSGMHTIGRSLFIYEILKNTLQTPGHIAEFGCWKGNNLLFMAKVLSLLQHHSIKQIYGFDSFEGLQTFSKEDGESTKEIFQNTYVGNEANIRDFLSLYEMESWVNLVIGDAMTSIDKFDKENPHLMFSLCYIDFDLYQPCAKALEFSDARLSVGGYILLDEALTDTWKGEGQALREFLTKNEGKYEMIGNHITRQPTVVLKKIK